MSDDPVAFIDYLNAVDDILEARRGFTSEQSEMDAIAVCQDNLMSPEECADEIMEEDTDEADS